MGEGELHEGFRSYLYDDFLPKRIQKDIWAHVILSNSEAHEAYVAMEDEATKKSVIYIQDTDFILHSEMILYGENRIVCAMYTPSELCGFRLVSDSLWKSWKSIFDLVWRGYGE